MSFTNSPSSLPLFSSTFKHSAAEFLRNNIAVTRAKDRMKCFTCWRTEIVILKRVFAKIINIADEVLLTDRRSHSYFILLCVCE